ncbi:hypothetical protein CROQUDRAFT_91071 [Cronartium quercuum f. sp. fusiforme G11]|uniref:Uncharacterized protein n=1 Tax=Cronartium quercuum f. sp. fusiforme G11 TaxID=708437 RepID=A0A9P6TDI9_9BASI|nr:hypothetical protein CROQUDRAFT_91071 [Cronartium quercuum f. sp. fusiforme G11]
MICLASLKVDLYALKQGTGRLPITVEPQLPQRLPTPVSHGRLGLMLDTQAQEGEDEDKLIFDEGLIIRYFGDRPLLADYVLHTRRFTSFVSYLPSPE